MTQSYRLIINTCPDQESALKVANRLVESRLAACVSLLPKVTSIYQWKGKLETSEEVMLLIKTLDIAYPAVESAITEVHPYELPEIISVPFTEGSDQYLSWISENINTDHIL